MATELWQRIRAARKAADLRQEDLATPCEVSRSAVAQWESAREDIRTVPSLRQLSIIADLTGFPVTMLMDRNASDADFIRARWAVDRPRPAATSPAKSSNGAGLEMFSRALEYELVMNVENGAAAVENAKSLVSQSGLPLPLVFFNPELSAAVATEDSLTTGLAGLWAAEANRPNPARCRVLLLWVPPGTQAPSPTTESTLFSLFQVTLAVVRTPSEAAEAVRLRSKM